MTRTLVCVAVSVCVAVACSKQTPSHADRVSVPPLFDHVPADSPYVMGSFEFPPPAIIEFGSKMYGPMLAKLKTDARYAELFSVLDSELGGKWTAESLQNLGFSATPRFAIYGLGMFPVLRVEIRDEQKLLATILRVAGKFGVALPPPERGRAVRSGGSPSSNGRLSSRSRTAR
jgi:hypothetical protein